MDNISCYGRHCTPVVALVTYIACMKERKRKINKSAKY